MLDIVQQTINFYFKYLRAPRIEELEIKNKKLLDRKWSIFVTLYVFWVIKWSAWNIKEIEENIVLEIIANTIYALTKDSRFDRIEASDKENIKIRIDEIAYRWKPLSDWMIDNVDPLKRGVIVIKSDYMKSATILPNISGKIMNWEDFEPVLSKKLSEKFDDKDYLVYEIRTDKETNL